MEFNINKRSGNINICFRPLGISPGQKGSNFVYCVVRSDVNANEPDYKNKEIKLEVSILRAPECPKECKSNGYQLLKDLTKHSFTYNEWLNLSVNATNINDALAQIEVQKFLGLKTY